MHATDFLAPTKNFTDRIEDEYALKIGPEFKKIMSNKVVFHDPEIAFVYQSFGASAFPQDPDGFNLYNENSNEMEALLHMMGVHMDIVPLEKLGITDLDKYKLVVIPDAMYLTEDKINRQARPALKTDQVKVLINPKVKLYKNINLLTWAVPLFCGRRLQTILFDHSSPSRSIKSSSLFICFEETRYGV